MVTAAKIARIAVHHHHRQIEGHALPILSPHELELSTRRNMQVLTHAAKKMRSSVAAGPDAVSAPQIKRAPSGFLKLLAFFAAWATEQGVFPENFRLARLKHIPKKEKGSFRGISIEDLITKMIEQCVAHPIFPAFGRSSPLIADEQLANRRGLSSEMAACMLAMVVEDSRGSPLLAVVADVKGAYPNLWRDGVWAKLADSHGNISEVKQLMAVFPRISQQIIEPGFSSNVVDMKAGFPQGAPRSGDIFGFYNSDIPSELRELGAGVSVRGVQVTCGTFLDDSWIPTREQHIVREVLQALASYGERWAQLWAVNKFKVINFSSTKCPAQWMFRNHWVDTVTEARVLGVLFHATRGWVPHFAEKLGVARFVAAGLRRAGLLGGRNPPAACLVTVRAMVWATLDYGRIVANLRDPGHKGIQAKIELFQFQILREVLGVSSKAHKLGVIGESGELLDIWRERQRQMLGARQMLKAPPGSLPRRMAEAAQHAEAKLGLFRLVAEILEEQKEVRDISSFGSKGDIRGWIRKQATQEWRQSVRASSRLMCTYEDVAQLETRGYLKADFKGRQVLTKLRVDDLNLGAASYNAKLESPPSCLLCGEEPETREHFLLRCRKLEGVRDAHPDVYMLIQGLSRRDAWRTLILARPRGATEDLERAKRVGTLVHDLWTSRAKALGLSSNAWFR